MHGITIKKKLIFSIGGMILAEKLRTLSIMNQTWVALGSDLGLCSVQAAD
jgi:hypothetical protein